jgi:4-hydroxy-tetrahydrodipicolinate reductase
MIRVGLVGIGKTGKEIARVLLEQEDIMLVAAICSPYSRKKGKDLGEVISCKDTGIIIDSADNLEEIIFKSKPDVIVDFSSPEATMRNARVFSKMRVNIVIATTGFSKLSLKRLFVLTRKYRNGIVYAPNITLGVNVMMLITNIAARLLTNYDFQITEIHHKRKKDAPSGTAFKIAKEIEKGLLSSGIKLKGGEVPIHAVRAGGVVGKHEVLIIGEEDKIEISHESFSRRVFALGALKAVRFLYKKTGFYEMSDVLNLDKILGDYVKKEELKRHKIFNRYNAKHEDIHEESWA